MLESGSKFCCFLHTQLQFFTTSFCSKENRTCSECSIHKYKGYCLCLYWRNLFHLTWKKTRQNLKFRNYLYFLSENELKKIIYVPVRIFFKNHKSVMKTQGGCDSPSPGSQDVSHKAKSNSDFIGSETHSSVTLSNHLLFSGVFYCSQQPHVQILLFYHLHLSLGKVHRD